MTPPPLRVVFLVGKDSASTRHLADTKLYIPKKDSRYDALKVMIGAPLNLKQIRTHWNDILRLATSIKQGTVTASLMLRKLGSYPRQNGLALALRELGRIERTLFILDWLQNADLRRRVQGCLNKGEARNALARAVFFHRLGEVRGRGFEQQSNRASGLNLLTAAIVLWNTVYLQRAVDVLRKQGPSTRPCCRISLRSAGSTSTSLATTFGAPAPFHPRAAFVPCARSIWLNVRYIPFSEGTP